MKHHQVVIFILFQTHNICTVRLNSFLSLSCTDVKEENVNAEVQKEAMEASGWLQFSAPKPTVSISVSSHYLVAIDTYDTVHYCALGGLGLKWQRADCKASQIALSPNLDCVWRLYENVAYALKNPASSGNNFIYMGTIFFLPLLTDKCINSVIFFHFIKKKTLFFFCVI